MSDDALTPPDGAVPEVVAGSRTDEIFRFGRFSLTRSGVQVLTGPGAPAEGDWVTALSFVKTVSDPIEAWHADLVNLGEQLYGDRAFQILHHKDWKKSTVDVYRWAFEKIPPEVRRLDALDVTHHVQVASLPVPEQKRILDAAAEGQWSVGRVSREVKISKGLVADPVLWLLVSCVDDADRLNLTARMQSEGRRVKG